MVDCHKRFSPYFVKAQLGFIQPMQLPHSVHASTSQSGSFPMVDIVCFALSCVKAGPGRVIYEGDVCRSDAFAIYIEGGQEERPS